MRIKYAHSPESIYPHFLIRRDDKMEEILGATGT